MRAVLPFDVSWRRPSWKEASEAFFRHEDIVLNDVGFSSGS